MQYLPNQVILSRENGFEHVKQLLPFLCYSFKWVAPKLMFSRDSPGHCSTGVLPTCGCDTLRVRVVNRVRVYSLVVVDDSLRGKVFKIWAGKGSRDKLRVLWTPFIAPITLHSCPGHHTGIEGKVEVGVRGVAVVHLVRRVAGSRHMGGDMRERY
jgi:hypothetical protein